MSDTDTGGPAFPVPLDAFDDREGMTLRDYFAAHAPNPPETWKAEKDEAANIIEWRWAYADAMLKARQQ